MPDYGAPRDTGRRAVESLRRAAAVRLVDTLRRHDPDLLAAMTEVGIVRRDWIEDPTAGPMSTSTPIEVVERLLERSIERKPSLMASLGLNTIQTLSASSRDDQHPAGAVPASLAIAFTDLEGFTGFTARRGDEAARALLTEHHRRVGPVVRSRGGRIVKRLGDGLLLSFPEPEAAVLAGLELVDQPPEPLRLRCGMHMGDVLVTRDDVVGNVVNIAARVAESAKGGQVLVTDAMAAVVADNLPSVAFGKARRRTYKGIAETVRTLHATWAEGPK